MGGRGLSRGACNVTTAPDWSSLNGDDRLCRLAGDLALHTRRWHLRRRLAAGTLGAQSRYGLELHHPAGAHGGEIPRRRERELPANAFARGPRGLCTDRRPVARLLLQVGYRLSEIDLYAEITRRLGDWIVVNICPRLGLFAGACLVLAAEIAKGDV